MNFTYEDGVLTDIAKNSEIRGDVKGEIKSEVNNGIIDQTNIESKDEKSDEIKNKTKSELNEETQGKTSNELNVGTQGETANELNVGTKGTKKDGNKDLSHLSGKIEMSKDYVMESGGLLSALSRKSAEILRKGLSSLRVQTYSDDTLSKLSRVLVHTQPHIDEYISSWFFRSCLPDEKYDISKGEVALFSQDNDETAKTEWSNAAVLGVGNVVNGGAQALLQFDEHGMNSADEQHSNSLAMLLKRTMLGSQRPPYPLYQLLNEVDVIDAFGGGHAKNLATYVKYLNNIPIFLIDKSSTEHNHRSPYFLDNEWKSAIVDACLAALFLALSENCVDFTDEKIWLPALKVSLADYSARTALQTEASFKETRGRLYSYLTNLFIRSKTKGDLVFHVMNEEGVMIPKITKDGKKTSLLMLMPYMPYLCYKYWGGVLGQFLLLPFWECRFYKDISFINTWKTLNSEITSLDEDIINMQTSVGEFSLLHCKPSDNDDNTPWIIDFFPTPRTISPGPINRFLKIKNKGIGYTIFRDPHTDTIVLSKGEGSRQLEWRLICDKLLELEGSANDVGVECGCWHVTKNPFSIASFLLNGNPTHRYVPKSKITAQSLADIVNDVRSNICPPADYENVK